MMKLEFYNCLRCIQSDNADKMEGFHQQGAEAGGVERGAAVVQQQSGHREAKFVCLFIRSLFITLLGYRANQTTM